MIPNTSYEIEFAFDDHPLQRLNRRFNSIQEAWKTVQDLADLRDDCAQFTVKLIKMEENHA